MNTAKLNELVGDGKFFFVKFVKKSGEVREMTCRTGVKAYVKGTGKPAPEHIMRVWEASGGRKEAEAYRCFDVNSIIEIHVNGKVYKKGDLE